MISPRKLLAKTTRKFGVSSWLKTSCIYNFMHIVNECKLLKFATIIKKKIKIHWHCFSIVFTLRKSKIFLRNQAVPDSNLCKLHAYTTYWYPCFFRSYFFSIRQICWCSSHWYVIWWTACEFSWVSELS